MSSIPLFRIFEGSINYYKSLYSNKEGYYKRFINSITLSDILDVLKTEDENEFQSKKEIRVYGIAFNSNIAQLTNKMGSPKFLQSVNFEGLNHTTCFYKRLFFNHRVIVQFHFINNLFFYCNMSFMNLTDRYETKLLKILNEKYRNDFEGPAVKSISDCNKNFIRFEKILWPSVIYANKNPAIRNMITKQMELEKVVSITSHKRQTDEWRNNL